MKGKKKLIALIITIAAAVAAYFGYNIQIQEAQDGQATDGSVPAAPAD